MVVWMERESRTDAELLRRSRRDPDAFVFVCRRHAVALEGWLTAQVRDAGLARELLAETFSEAWFSRVGSLILGTAMLGRGCSGSRGISSAASIATVPWPRAAGPDWVCLLRHPTNTAR